MNNSDQELIPITEQNQPHSSVEERNALYIVAALIITPFLSIGVFLYYGVTTNTWQVEVIAFIVLVVSIIAFFTIPLDLQWKTCSGDDDHSRQYHDYPHSGPPAC